MRLTWPFPPPPPPPIAPPPRSPRPRATSAITPANVPGGNFSDFLSGAIKDSINTIRQGEQAASQQVQGKANLVDVVQSVNAAEITLDTVVAVRDKVVAAYQSIMNMPI